MTDTTTTFDLAHRRLVECRHDDNAAMGHRPGPRCFCERWPGVGWIAAVLTTLVWLAGAPAARAQPSPPHAIAAGAAANPTDLALGASEPADPAMPLERVPRSWLVVAVLVQALLLIALTVAAIARHRAAAALAREALQRQRAEQKLAIAKSELQRFAEITAHHLQEPTRRLMVFAQRLHRLLATPADDNTAFALRTIEDQAAYLHALVRDVQVYLAADTPLGPLGPTDPAAVAREVLGGLSERVTASGGRVTVGVTVPVPLDRPRLRYLLSALIDNALRYGGRENQPPQVVIEGRALADGVELTVADHGTGIPVQYRSRVLEVFEHLHPHGAGIPGTGLGLAVARRIAESADGTLAIHDMPGGGTRIVITLPPCPALHQGDPT